jgi:hypothetical protein
LLFKLSDTSNANVNSENRERAKVVKDFCFPDGVPVIKLGYDPSKEVQSDEVEEVIQDILYGVKNWRECTFIFTLDSNEQSTQEGQSDGD